MPQLGSILRLRRRLTKNRLARLGPRRRSSTLVLIVGGMVAVLVGGHLAAPLLMEPPVDLATPRGLAEDALPAGAAALEAAFWLTALLATVLNFRVLELLFRRPDVVALQSLPIEPSAFFVDRFAATATEALVSAAAASLFFIPLCWHGGAAAALASMGMLFGGLLFGATVSLMVMLVATQRLIPPQDDASPTNNSRAGILSDPYGGPGQLLLYAPAVALGGVVVLALFWKLLLGEPLRLGYFSEPFWIGTVVVVGSSVACLFVAYRSFVQDYYAMVPRFHEADATDFSAVTDYQESSFDITSAWEWGLPDTTALLSRALLLDDDRRMAGARVGYAVVVILAVIALLTTELEALPMWAVAVAPALLMAAVVNPWRRLTERAQQLDRPMALPLSNWDRIHATDRIAIREFLFVAVPYGLAAAVILGEFRGVGTPGVLAAAASIAIGLGITGGVTAARLLGISHRALQWLPAVLLVVFGIGAIASLSLAVLAGFGVYAAALTFSYFVRSRS